MLWFDLDNFKEINDSLGHAAGDKLLQSVANLLSGETRGYSLVARLGGDEFGLLIPRADATEAVNTAMRILDVMAIRSFSVASHEVRVSASVGVVLYPTHGESVDDLLARADLAMYHAKSHGGNRLSVYTSDDHWRTEMSERIGLAEHIVSALRDDRLRLFAQPTVRVEDGSPGPTELLLRMDDGEGGFVLPDEILSTATRIGLSRDVDAWVVRKAIALLAAEQAGGSLVPLSVNLTGAALSDPDIIRAMADAAAQSGADLAGLVVEVGEASAVADIQRAQAFIRDARALGCRFALDDFGSGPNSFLYLKHLPVDMLKIDEALVSALTAPSAEAHFVRAIVEMCKGFGIETVAENVETPELLDLVAEYGIDFAQGYAVARPAPAEKYLRGARGAQSD